MTRWFRFYDETLNDPKILRLNDNLYRIWVGVLCAASKNEGRLPPLQDLCLMLRLTPLKMASALKSLIESELIDDNGEFLEPHNWNGRQYKSDVSTERVKRFRQRHRNVSVTPPDTDTDTEKKDAASAAILDFGRAEPPQPTSQEKQYYERARELLGAKYGGSLGAKLLKVKGGLSLARSALEQAATKSDPREYVGACIRGHDPQGVQRGMDPRL